MNMSVGSARLVACGMMLACAAIVTAADEEKFTPLFNGKDLTGWKIVNVAPDTFTVKDGIIVSTGKPTGTIRTDRMYENFILELEWRHLKAGGNAGVFVWGDPLTAVGTPFSRGIEVQVLDGRETESYTSHGDVFSIWGASMKPDRPHPKGSQRCLPSEKRCKPSPEWNHYRVVCNDGIIKLHVNGKEVSGGTECNPRKGYICLESEGSECHFRNIQIRELPSTNAPPSATANAAQGFVPLLADPELSAWRKVEGNEGHWKWNDGRLDYDGKSEAKTPYDQHLWTKQEFGDFELVVDWRLPNKPQKKEWPLVLPSGEDAVDENGKPKLVAVDDAGNSGILMRGYEHAQANICCRPVGSGEITEFRTNKKYSAEVRAGVTPKKRADKPNGQWNRFIITMQGDRVSVVLNGELIIDKAQLPDVPQRGPIGLQHHGEAMQFGNIFVREL
ncbi:hypothetical protein ETAA8_70920 [Anatilimnocola aggregata]|uniref:3-keto-alpha-glucoside-1,2-lyase/3-keto-2-hydroxy-glucal hydratase domain-containing protein n=1 Tax=Anatilimnocola aggregata TaxID=2528021 RepID=A0A517YNY7_9BACT|nr:DUF1080 domain-containing protein [Anatilimnocola aggregata]QDU31930.1 hypothetical protein ETAA8_70920 [Anatilimnocola aggregata]